MLQPWMLVIKQFAKNDYPAPLADFENYGNRSRIVHIPEFYRESAKLALFLFSEDVYISLTLLQHNVVI